MSGEFDVANLAKNLDEDLAIVLNALKAAEDYAAASGGFGAPEAFERVILRLSAGTYPHTRSHVAACSVLRPLAKAIEKRQAEDA